MSLGFQSSFYQPPKAKAHPKKKGKAKPKATKRRKTNTQKVTAYKAKLIAEAKENKRRRTTPYNGYKNWDTWAFILNMGNEESNHRYIKDNKKALLAMKGADTLKTIKRYCYFADKDIKLANVSISDVKNYIRET